MWLCHHHVDGRYAGGVGGDRNAAAVVGDLDTAILKQHYVHCGCITGHRLVDRVVDHLPNEMV